MIILAFVFLGILSWLQASPCLLVENKISREDNGTKENLLVDVLLQGEEQYLFEDINISIEEREYTQKEFEEIIQSNLERLKKLMLHENESLEKVMTNLFLPDELFQTGVFIKWSTDSETVSNTGTVHNDDLNRCTNVTLTAGFQYKEYQMTYKFFLVVYPKVYTKEEQLRKEFSKELLRAMEEGRKEEVIILPNELNGYDISYQAEKEAPLGKLILIGILLALIIWFLYDQEILELNKKRQEKLLLDYPEMVQKLTLLVSAGLTVRGAFHKIVEQKNQKEKGNSYLEQEVLFTLNEIQMGINEATAYEHMGRRIGLIPYLRLGTYLSQNLKKGSRGLIEQLMKEAANTFEDRKHTARQLGEKASTKLLIPMMIMLVIVLVITMYPAFSSITI